MPRCPLIHSSSSSYSALTSPVPPQLWMGTHPSCPSTLMATGQDLKKYLKSRPELLGDKVVMKFGDDLPFLFKVRWTTASRGRVCSPSFPQVLAIRKALSIQAHPDKQLAQKLHSEKPDIYKGEASCLRLAFVPHH